MIKLFADGADMNGIIEAAANPNILGFTTNPTLMRQAGVTDYTEFANTLIAKLASLRPDTCLSLEVFADNDSDIIRQARLIDSWGKKYSYHVYVKIPIMHTDGTPTYNLIKQLSDEGISLNVTAVFTLEQIKNAVNNLNTEVPSIVSVFAGRLADIGIDPVNIIVDGIDYCYEYTNHNKCEFLWASSREAFNYIEADGCGCHIITMTPDLIKKVHGFGIKNPTQFSKETCQMFFNDAVASGYTI